MKEFRNDCTCAYLVEDRASEEVLKKRKILKVRRGEKVRGGCSSALEESSAVAIENVNVPKYLIIIS